MKIYRIQHVNSKRGPFHTNYDDVCDKGDYQYADFEELDNALMDDIGDYFAGAIFDILTFTPGKHSVACPSMKHILRTFEQYRELFIACGFRLYEYHVPYSKIHQSISGTQVAFARKDAYKRVCIW